MKVDHFSALFHDLLGDLSSIRNTLHFLLTERAAKLNQEDKYYLKESLKKSQSLLIKIERLKKEVKKFPTKKPQ